MTAKKRTQKLTKVQFRAAITPLLAAFVGRGIESSTSIKYLYINPTIHRYVKSKFNRNTWEWPEQDVMEDVISNFLLFYFKNVKLHCTEGGDFFEYYLSATRKKEWGPH